MKPILNYKAYRVTDSKRKEYVAKKVSSYNEALNFIREKGFITEGDIPIFQKEVEAKEYK